MRITSAAAGLIVLLATAAPAAAATDEDQVRSVLDVMNGSYNRSDFAGFASHLCSGMLSTRGYEAGWYASRSADGPTRIVVNSVDVRGDPPSLAVANVKFVAANHADAKVLDVEFLRVGADWKACRFEAGQYI
jgi:hypothetical protein